MTAQFLPQSLLPGQVRLEYEGGSHLFTRIGTQLSHRDMALEMQVHHDEEGHSSLKILLMAEKSRLVSLRLQWNHPVVPHLRFLGDQWGAATEPLQWRTMDPCRKFPWYVLMRGSEETTALGVTTPCAGFAVWRTTPRAIILDLDLRNGNRGVALDGRVLEAATVLHCRYERPPMATARRFCALLSPEPILPNLPVYGFTTPEAPLERVEILALADTLSLAANGLTNRPFLLLDHRRIPDASDAEELPALSEALRERGIRPALNRRLLATPGDGVLPAECRQQAFPGSLDPTCPETREYLEQQMHLVRDWGFDMLGIRNPATDILHYGSAVQEPWEFRNAGVTNAEVLTGFHSLLRQNMGDLLLYGQDLVGHLAAGLVHIAQTAPISEGGEPGVQIRREINALAFRLCQHGNYFTLAPNPLELPAGVSWHRRALTAKLFSHAGSAFFVAPKAPVLPAKVLHALAKEFYSASLGNLQAIPTDWLENTCPELWTLDGAPFPLPWKELE